MPATQTLLEMRDRAKVRADFDDAASAGFMTDAKWTEFINQGCQKVYHLLVKARGHEFYVTQDDFNTVAGTSEYAMPSDHFLTLSLHVAASSGSSWRRVKGWQESDLGRLWSATRGTHSDVYGRVQATNVVLLPTPTQVFRVRHRYVPTFTKLTADGDTFDGVNGWEEMVVLHAAMAALKKEGSMDEAAPLAAEYAEWKEMIEGLAPHRHLTEPDHIPERYENSTEAYIHMQTGGHVRG